MKRIILASLVVLAVGCGKKEYSVPSLLGSLKDKDPKMRYYAAKDEDKNVRMGAAYALAEIGPDAKTAIPALGEAAKDKEEVVRKAADYALKRLQDPNPQGKQGEQSTKPKHKHKSDKPKN
jgi:HEAT repeat protein